MLAWFHPQPVGSPGLIAFMAGWLLFFASMVWTRIGASRGGDGPPARKSSLSKWGVAIQCVAFAGTGYGGIWPDLPSGSPRALIDGALVAALMSLAVLLFTAASRAMGANWSIVARMREDHELVTGGIFAWLRHPIYTAMAAFLLAMAIAFGHLAVLLVTAPVFLIGTAIRIWEEEKLLHEQFGPAYEAYAGRVKRFLPGLI